MKKKVVLMSLEGCDIEQSPAKYQLLSELSERGFETYVFCPGRLKRRKVGKIIESIDHVINVEGMQGRSIRRKIININPHVVIATAYVNTAVIFNLPFRMKNTAFFYYNLEIYTPYLNKDIKKENFGFYVNYKFKYPINKIKEILYTKSVRAFTIQDSLRRNLSKKYYVWHPNTILIPNSYIFDESEIIPDWQSGIIYAGGIKRDFLIKQFDDLKTVKNVPLTFSGVIDQWCMERIKKLKRTNPNLKFKNQMLSINEYTDYMRTFAVGLVWYSSLKEDEANYCIGMSSGKMFKHLSLGQPIIAVRCLGIAEVVNKYNLGVVIDNISELESAYNTIMRNYSYYRENVIRTYKNKFDFKKVIVPFIECIEESVVIKD